jgi:hypothetical protein
LTKPNSPGTRAMQDRCGSAAPRSAPG